MKRANWKWSMAVLVAMTSVSAWSAYAADDVTRDSADMNVAAAHGGPGGGGGFHPAPAPAPRPQPIAPRPQPIAPRPQPIAPRPQPIAPRPQPIDPRPIDPRPIGPRPIGPRPIGPGPVYPRPINHTFDPINVRIGGLPWAPWEHPIFERPVFGWNWDGLTEVTCTAEDSNGDVYPVTDADYYGVEYQANLDSIEDAALDRCYDESGGDEGCQLVTCTPNY